MSGETGSSTHKPISPSETGRFVGESVGLGAGRRLDLPLDAETRAGGGDEPPASHLTNEPASARGGPPINDEQLLLQASQIGNCNPF